MPGTNNPDGTRVGSVVATIQTPSELIPWASVAVYKAGSWIGIDTGLPDGSRQPHETDPSTARGSKWVFSSSEIARSGSGVYRWYAS